MNECYLTSKNKFCQVATMTILLPLLISQRNTMKSGALFEPSRFMEAAESRITDAQTKQSLQEPPWDGAYLRHQATITTCNTSRRFLRLAQSV